MTKADLPLEELPLRQRAAALMIDHRDQVLVVKLDLRGWVGWVLPGGGIEEGEDVITALRRELLEETGLKDPFIGPVVCIRRQVGPAIAPGFGGMHETIHLVPCHDFALAPTLSRAELRDEGIIDTRWFSVDELRATSDKVIPRQLPDLIERVLAFGGSIEPLEINVQERNGF